MKKLSLAALLLLLCSTFAFAQNEKDKKEKKTAKEVINEIPEMLIAQPDAGPDTNANKLISDNLSMEIPPIWKTKGTLTITDFKLPKTDQDPLKETFPMPEKQIVQSVAINLSTVKKAPADKKQLVINNVKQHLTSWYKDAGLALSAADATTKVNSMVSLPDTFTTAGGLSGELYYINDINSQQSSYQVVLLIPGSNPGTTHFAQIQFIRYNYETTYPEDILEWKTFVYPDEEKLFTDFAKKMLRTLKVL